MNFGILTVSDRCSKGKTDDISSTCLKETIENTFSGSTFVQKIVPDEIDEIKAILIAWCDAGCDVIFTSGGTGFAPRDVTPEATKQVIEKEAPGLIYTMISKSLAITDMAMLSRPVCGIRKETLIVNLPGSPKGTLECFGFIKSTLEHAVALIKDDKKSVEKLHKTQRKTVIKEDSSCASKDSTEDSSPSKVQIRNDANRPRESPYPMLEVQTACTTIINECIKTLDMQVLPYNESVDRVLAQDIFADEPIPPFPASMKDGYAVRSTDTEKIRAIRQVVTAGDQPSQESVRPGEAVRISTGAAVPPGADAVIQIEDTTVYETSPNGDRELSIELQKNPVAGQDIRAVGSDICGGSLVLKKFERLSPAHIGVLASLGKTEVKVFKPPSIAVLSTGNEVKDPREKLQPGQIRDSNKSVLINTLKKYSYDSTDCGIVKDDPNMIKRALEKAFADHDVVITTGGVSMGELDVVKEVLNEDFNAVIHFGRVNMKPGKPTTFATLKYKGNIKYFFGLPGNPVSCSVTLILFVIPALRYMERTINYNFPVVTVQVDKELINHDSRPEYHRIVVSPRDDGYLRGESTGKQISSRLNSMVEANGLALVSKTSKIVTNTPNTPKNIFGHNSSPFNHKSLFEVPVSPANKTYTYYAILFDNIK